jgi:drug/metabolite transporter (DMT)-like permease
MSNVSSLSRQKFLFGLCMGILGAIFFSGKAIVAKLLYRYHIDAVTVVAFRMLFSFPFFILIGLWKAYTEKPLSCSYYVRIIILGLLGYYLSSFLDFLGLQYISAGLERLILFLTPSFVLLIAVFFRKKRVSSLEWFALMISYCGVILVFIHDALKGGNHIQLGSLLVLGSAITYACYLTFSDDLVKHVGTIRLVAYAMCISSLACIAQFFILKPFHTLQQPYPVYLLSLVNAIICTVLPVFLTMFSVSTIGAGTASQAGMVGPISTLMMGAFFLNEPITPIQIIGTILVISGIYLLSKKKP